MRAAKYCPVCEKVWDLSHDRCPTHPTVLTVRVWKYDERFLIFNTESFAASDPDPGEV